MTNSRIGRTRFHRMHRDAFDILGLSPVFDIDLRQLRAVWMRRAAADHPDAAGSLEESTCVNEAYRVLVDPVLRAEALLVRRKAPEVDARQLPVGFLESMMELRERADEARGDAQRLAELRAHAEAGKRSALSDISEVFRADRGPQITGESAQLIRSRINVARSFERMIEQLDREAEAS